MTQPETCFDLNDPAARTELLGKIFKPEERKIDVLCFDFFDTLVYRVVVPEDTKRLAAKQLGVLIGEELAGNLLYYHRCKLEAEMCQQNAAAGGDPEFNFLLFASQFYSCLKTEYTGFPEHLSETDFTQWVLDIELATEKQVQKLKPGVIALLDAIRRKQICMAIVSDFYVPGEHFRVFLKHHGIAEHFEQVFISADHGVKKSSGRLYDQVFSRFGCSPENVVMIGDNPHSDSMMARKKGIRAFSVAKFSGQSDSGSAQTFYSVKEVETDIQSILSENGGDVFPEIGAVLYRFIFLLFQKLVTANVKQVFFFSKEGEFLKVLFDQFQKERFGSKVIQTHYLLVSRKSTYICALKPLDQERFTGIFQQYRKISPKDFLLSLNITESEAREVCQNASVAYDRRIANFNQSDQFHAILQTQSFRLLYESKRTDQRHLFLEYLTSFNVDFSKNGLHIVDVGWKGSIQDNLFNIFERKIPINGYYIGLLYPTNLTPMNQKHGVLFSNHPQKTDFYDVYRSNTSLFEIALGATHGSADQYIKFTDPKRLETAVQVALVDLPEERKLYREKIQPIQAHIASVFQQINQMACVRHMQLPGDRWHAKQHARMIFRPTRKEKKFFKDLYHLENFGIFEFSRFKGKKRLPMGQRWDHLKQAVQNPASVSERGIWHPILLEKMGIGFTSGFFGERAYRNALPQDRKGFRLTGGTVLKTLTRLRVKRHTQIAFFLGTPEISGGTYVIFEHAVRLKQKGYPVFIVTREDVDPDQYKWHPEAGMLEWLNIQRASEIYFDIVVATWWQSAILLGQISAATYVYLIQSIESRFFPSDATATPEDHAYRRLSESTYLIPVPVITEAKWIQEYLFNAYGTDAFLARNGIRKEIYTEAGKTLSPREPGRLRVLVEGPLNVPHKNVEKTIELANRSDADEIWLLTSSEAESVSGADRVFSKIPILETPPIYRSCDVLLKLSSIEGMFGPPLEIFHCGGTAIVYDVTGHDEYIQNLFNGLVLPMGDEAGVIHHLNLLKHDPNLLEHLKSGARTTAADWPDWKVASDQFETILKKLMGRTWPNQTYLSKASNYLIQSCETDKQVALTQGTSHQILQIYWHSGTAFSEPVSLKRTYSSGDWNLIREKFKIDSSVLYLRIDPCMQEGVVFFKRVSIISAASKQVLVAFDPKNRWEGIEILGTGSLLSAAGMLVMESTGSDPQVMIPGIEVRDDHGSEIVVEIEIKLLPHRMALREVIALDEINPSPVNPAVEKRLAG